MDTATGDALDQSRSLFFEGIRHFEADRLDDARACFERCLALTPGRPSVQGNLGITLCHLGRIAEALPLLQQATAADPGFVDAWVALGLAHEAQGEWSLAANAIEQALAMTPTERGGALQLRLGQCLMRLGRLDAALSALDRAVAAAPTMAAAWSQRGGLLRELRRLDAAAHSYEQALLHGADRALHEYYLAAVRGDGSTPPPPRAPRHYVETLFDDYAADFSHHVVDQLGYHGHEVLLAPVVASGRRFRHALDLGCGTGLCAPLLTPICDVIDGVDIASAMLGEARKLNLYRELVHADIVEHLAGASQRVDLMVAADVMIYVGELSGVFRDAARLLEPDGLFAFTVELPTDEQDLQLLPSLRYAHSQAYVQRLAAAQGLVVDALHHAPIRHEQTRPVAGLYVTLRRTA